MTVSCRLKHVFVIHTADAKKTFYLDKDCYSIGRNRDNSIIIKSRKISRKHATLIKKKDENNNYRFCIIDGDLDGNRSSNGIFINGNQQLEHQLNHGDCIYFNEEVRANYYFIDHCSDPWDSYQTQHSPEDKPYTTTLPDEEFKQTIKGISKPLNTSSFDLEKLVSLVELSPYPILEIDWQGQLTYLNIAAKIKFQTLKQTRLNHPIFQGLLEGELPKHQQLIRREINIDQATFEQYIHYLPDSQLIRSYMFDITQLKRSEETLKYHAFYDHLTGLPNRIFFNEHLSIAIANAHRYQKSLAILFLDLDKFKTINDNLGHDIGDQILKYFAQLLRSQLRGGDVLSRWGGDEFTILLPQIKHPDETATLAQRILDNLQQPVTIDEHQIDLQGSIGIAIFPQDAEDGETLLQCADIALYRTKELGRNHYQFYNPSLLSNEISNHLMTS